MTDQIEIFKNEQFGEIRTVMRQGDGVTIRDSIGREQRPKNLSGGLHLN